MRTIQLSVRIDTGKLKDRHHVFFQINVGWTRREHAGNIDVAIEHPNFIPHPGAVFERGQLPLPPIAPIKRLLDKYLELFTIIFMVLLIGGFVLIKYTLH